VVSKLLQVMGLLYRMEADDRTQLETQLLDRRKQAWTLALTEQARKYRCSRAPEAPRKQDLTELKRMSKEDAVGITKTWNGDVERQLQKLYDANPRGNRNYYAANMEQWARARGQWKDAQIAMQTEHSTRYYAKMRFFEMNTIRPRFKVVGPPPVCPICIGHFGAGIVDMAYIRRNPAPFHVNCPHEWAEAVITDIPCNELWLGE
jgi:hypothetical protein